MRKVTVLALGAQCAQCPHCHAKLWTHEQTGFCCQYGKHAINFTTYFRAPSPDLLRLYASSWPLRDLAGNVSRDSKTNADKLTSFSVVSRRYNNMFALASHEIHSSTASRECKFGNELRPSNIRIHGTMYRRVRTAADQTPLRYLLVDPTERAAVAQTLGLDKKLLHNLEVLILPHNPHMQKIKRLSQHKQKLPEASISLQWHEGVNEVAAVISEHAEDATDPRAVVFTLSSSTRPQYIHPLNALYEPLSYPLWYPYGGRGWSTDIYVNKCKISQMWWYRQQLLRFEHMHMCGRLLNEWLVNMYCRMEDERLALLRRDQTAKTVQRKDIGEDHSHELQTPSAGKQFWLPASITGSPRHLRRMRIDALELARRKGAPSFFITLTCNPHWPEITAALRSGQTAADRPDIVVRVFHGRLSKLMAYLKERFAGRSNYSLRVIEYQMRGLPHAHIVVCCASPPRSPEEVDLLISCELPHVGSSLRDKVLEHMVHKCTHPCHPDDPSQDCKKGCPWPFVPSTYFDARGYPHMRRRPCGITCPNCITDSSAYGRRKVCLNQLIVEYSPAILDLWDGHANVKFAGSVNLFEYLYKYLFKGPDRTNYDVTLDAAVKDEITEWQRGRYLCATECAWRIFGYDTYERTPHVVCLPLHLQGGDWVIYEDGTAEAAANACVSPLLRYFYRPPCEPFSLLKYNEYYEHFMISPTCPHSLRSFFPHLFKRFAQSAADTLMRSISAGKLL